MKIHTLNNATLVFESKRSVLVVDPWIIGHLYWGSWSPSRIASLEQEHLIRNADYLFISHLHNDHWDIETIRLMKRSVRIFLPRLPFVERVIGQALVAEGFLDIIYISCGEEYVIDDEFSIQAIEPLNAYGSEDYLYTNDSSNQYEVAVDTGLIVKDRMLKHVHIALCDNTPYSPSSAETIRTGISHDWMLKTLWYPFNGAAQDYPLCYDNLSTEEKKKCIAKRNSYRNDRIVKLVDSIQPQITLPYSSDFKLNGGRAEEFLEIHGQSLLRCWSTGCLSKLSKHNFQTLEVGQSIEFKDDDEFTIYGGCEEESDEVRQIWDLKGDSDINVFSSFSDGYSIDDIKRLSDVSLSRCVERLQSNSVELSNVDLAFFLSDIQFGIIMSLSRGSTDFFSQLESEDELIENAAKEYICLTVGSGVLGDLLSRKAHFDNLTICCGLKWYRCTDESQYPKSAYDALNFLHI